MFGQKQDPGLEAPYPAPRCNFKYILPDCGVGILEQFYLDISLSSSPEITLAVTSLELTSPIRMPPSWAISSIVLLFGLTIPT